MFDSITDRVSRFDRKTSFGSSFDKGLFGGYTKYVTARNPAKEKAMEIIKIKNFLRSLVKAHGFTDAFELKLPEAGTKDKLANAAFSIKHGRTTSITIPVSVYDNADSDDVLDIYSGIVLHEAQHLISSDWFFKELAAKKATGLRKTIYNIVEDLRIEQLIQDSSPGYMTYLDAARNYYFHGEFDKAEKEFRAGELSPVNSAMFIIFAALRYPRILTDEARCWEYNDIYPFDALSKYTSKIKTGEDVKELSQYILNILEDIKEKEDEERKEQEETGEKSDERSDETSEGGDSDDSFEGEGEGDDDGTEAKGETKDKDSGPADDPADLGGEGGSHEGKEEGDAGEGEASEGGGGKAKGIPDTTEMKDLIDALEGMDHAEEPIDDALNKEVEHLETTKFEEEEGEWENNRVKHKFATVEPVIEDTQLKVWDNLNKECNNDVIKMRRALTIRAGEMTTKSAEKKQGTLHRRMLGRAIATGSDRVFYTKKTTQAVGLDVCLLLDKSGSMDRAYDHRGDIHNTPAGLTLKMAYIIQEAVRSLPRTSLHIYSHHSYTAEGSSHDDDCLVERYYTPKRPDPKALTGFRVGGQNYDSKAIEMVGKEFMEHSSHAQKVMFVLSDGCPCGNDYYGEAANEATRKEIEKLEKQGVKMIQLAICSAPAGFFKHSIRFNNLKDLVPETTKIFRDLILGTGRETVG